MSDWNQLLPSSHTDTFTRDRLPPRAQWPVFIADRPELNYPDTLNATDELVDRHVREGRGARLAVHGVRDIERHAEPFAWTYAQLQEQVNRIAQVLRDALKGGMS